MDRMADVVHVADAVLEDVVLERGRAEPAPQHEAAGDGQQRHHAEQPHIGVEHRQGDVATVAGSQADAPEHQGAGADQLHVRARHALWRGGRARGVDHDQGLGRVEGPGRRPACKTHRLSQGPGAAGAAEQEPLFRQRRDLAQDRVDALPPHLVGDHELDLRLTEDHRQRVVPHPGVHAEHDVAADRRTEVRKDELGRVLLVHRQVQRRVGGERPCRHLGSPHLAEEAGVAAGLRVGLPVAEGLALEDEEGPVAEHWRHRDPT